jgi:hypothetical protein
VARQPAQVHGTRITAVMATGRARGLLRGVIDAGAVLSAVGFIATYFPTSVMFAPTITNGGDMGSHYYPAYYLREVLLPRLQLMGWCPGNYAGFPLFQFYFPLPFVLMVALSGVIPLAVAFKLVTVLGTFIMPLCSYLGLRLLGAPFPGPALGALASLCFLFMEANSMWGGNIPSTLAGEFTFSLGFALVILFLGTLRRTMETGRGQVGNGILEAVIGLCHGYALLWGGLVSLLELLTTHGWWKRLRTLIAVHGLAILLMGFWLVPLLYYAPWTTAFNPSWILSGWREVLPPILWGPAIVAVASAVIVAVLCWVRKEPFPRFLGTLWGAVFISILFWATAHSFHVVDVRFMPFLQLGICLAAGAGLGRVLAMLPVPEIWPVIGALVMLPFVQSQVTFIPGWVNWNYSGFERKGPWNVLSGINEFLEGDFRDPRVVYEHAPATESLGTVRAFENLPLFSGRSTLEGLYMQSGLTTPFVFYVQSEISKAKSCPLPAWGCTRLDLDQGVDHLRMFNVSQFIVRSPEVKKAVAEHDGLELQKKVGQYEIYRVVDNDGRYVIPLEMTPSLVRVEAWKEAAYQWFKHARPGDPVPVLASDASVADEAAFAEVFDELPRELPRVPLPDAPHLEEELDVGRVTVRGTTPGHPILVRMSYHPRWTATTGERVWLAAPNFMLVFPRGNQVELVFEAGPALTFGRICTAIGIFLCLAGTLPVARPLRDLVGRVRDNLAGVPPIKGMVGIVERVGAGSEATRRRAFAAGLGGVALLLTGFIVSTTGTDADGVYRKGQKLYGEGELWESLPYFVEARHLAPLSATAMHARYFEAIIYFRESKWAEAEQRFRTIVDEFPESPNAPEAYYHVGLCRLRQGDTAGAVKAWEETIRLFPASNWSGFSRERLDEIG